MEPVDPRIDPKWVPPGSRAVVVAELQDQFQNLPSVVTPAGVVITRWTLSDEERARILRGEDVFLTIWGVPIRPVHLNVGPCNWTDV